MFRLSKAHISNSTFINNHSKQGTHGFSIDTNSEMDFKHVTIYNDEEILREIMKYENQVTAGFFIVNG